MLMHLYIMSFALFIGLIMFCLKRKHLLLMLLSLEFIVLSLYMMIYIFLNQMNYEYFFLMIFLVMSVCEGSLGLAVLVSMIRTQGNDYIMSFSSLW
nr:NADH dehydrogenase subunit 4L [Saphanus piceus]